MATLNDRFTKELSEVQEDMEKTRLKIEVDLAGIRQMKLPGDLACFTLFTVTFTVAFPQHWLVVICIRASASGIEKEVAAMENKLKAQQLELHILMNYKVSLCEAVKALS